MTNELLLTVPNKCASQLMYQWAHKTLDLPPIKPDIQFNRTAFLLGLPQEPYSSRDAVRKYTKSKFQDEAFLGEFCDDSSEENSIPKRVLFVRHPLLRLISAWNDKFSMKNVDNASGASFGYRNIVARSQFLRPERQKIQQMFLEAGEEKCANHPVNPNNKFVQDCLQKIANHSAFVDEPYLVSFERLVKYMLDMEEIGRKSTTNNHLIPIVQTPDSNFEYDNR